MGSYGFEMIEAFLGCYMGVDSLGLFQICFICFSGLFLISFEESLKGIS